MKKLLNARALYSLTSKARQSDKPVKEVLERCKEEALKGHFSTTVVFSMAFKKRIIEKLLLLGFEIEEKNLSSIAIRWDSNAIKSLDMKDLQDSIKKELKS